MQLGLTLVAFYGPKPPALAATIAALQSVLMRLGTAYEPYAPEQVHATVVGLEGRWQGGALVSANFEALRGERRSMQLMAAIDALRARLPLRVQLGGFEPEVDYLFTSRGQHPYLRSFSLQPGRAVLMGWPCAEVGHAPQLAGLRRALELHGVLHKYHAQPTDADNDLFFVLGHVHGSEPEPLARAVEAQARELLRGSPRSLPLNESDLSLVRYLDPSLPIASSEHCALPQLTAARLQHLLRPPA